MSRASASEARPRWLRPTALALAVGAHCGLFVAFLVFSAEKATLVEDLNVELLPQGETVTETSVSPTPEAAPILDVEPTSAASPVPSPRDDPDATEPRQTAHDETADLLAPLARIEAPDAPPLAIDRPPIEHARQSQRRIEKKRPEEKEEAERLAAQRLARREKARARQQAESAQMGAAARQAGVRDGAGEAQRMSKAAYAAVVAAELNRHKHYPSSARQAGSSGAVGVTFIIGPSGSISGHAITHSSGDGAIDAAVREMLAASHPPPPPGGFFRGQVTISFDLTH